MRVELVIALLVAHFIADFVCQSDWMALNKSKDWGALGVHVLVYSVVLAAVVVGVSGNTPAALRFILANAVAHFLTDAITSRITSRLWFLPKVGSGMRPEWIQVEVKDTRHWFFVAIGADQLIHYVTLFVTAQWWLA